MKKYAIATAVLAATLALSACGDDDRADIVPTPTSPALAEAWRGGSRQASLARFLTLCGVEPQDEQQAKAVGALAGRADHDDIVDVTVVEGAARRRDAIVTSNHTYIARIANAARARLTIEPICVAQPRAQHVGFASVSSWRLGGLPRVAPPAPGSAQLFSSSRSTPSATWCSPGNSPTSGLSVESRSSRDRAS